MSVGAEPEARKEPRQAEPGARAATLKDVARLAEVDPSTASRVLRGDNRQRVRTETRDRIFEAARILRYRPNAVARSLRTRRTDTVAVIVPSLDNPGFIEVVQGIQAEAAQHGKLVLLVDASIVEDGGRSMRDREEVFARLVLDGRADGLILAFATLHDRLVVHLAERDLPIVLVNRRVPVIHRSVTVDDAAGARLAVEHLLSLGHRDIGSIGLDLDTDTSRRRHDGYRDALLSVGLRPQPVWTTAGPPTRAGGYEAALTLLEQSAARRPTAIFCSSLLGAMGALHALREANVRVPEDMSVVAFNDHELADDTAPALTTIRLPNLKMGREAMLMVMRAVEGLPVGDLMIPDPPQIVVRGSTAPPSAR